MILVNNFDTPKTLLTVMAEEISVKRFQGVKEKLLFFFQINGIICNIYEICIRSVNIAALVLKLEKT